MAECFCGCGRKLGFSLRKRAQNGAGKRISEDLELLRGALERDPETAADSAVPRLIHDGEALREVCRGLVHGTRDRTGEEKHALREWLDRMGPQRERLVELGLDYDGFWAHKNAKLALTGTRARARLVRVEDTGTTINNRPLARLVFEVHPEGGEPFEVTDKHVASRLNPPRAGVELDVFYDPEDRTKVTYREADLTPPVGAAQPAEPEG